MGLGMVDRTELLWHAVTLQKIELILNLRLDGNSETGNPKIPSFFGS